MDGTLARGVCVRTSLTPPKQMERPINVFTPHCSQPRIYWEWDVKRRMGANTYIIQRL